MLKRILTLIHALFLYEPETLDHQDALAELQKLTENNLDPDEKAIVQDYLEIVQAYHECAPNAQEPKPAPTIAETGYPLPIVADVAPVVTPEAAEPTPEAPETTISEEELSAQPAQ